MTEKKKFAGMHDIAMIMREKDGILVRDGEAYVKSVFDAITAALSEGKFDGICIKGILRITKKTVASRKSRNPRTGEIFYTQPHNGLSFKMGTVLKDAIR